MDKAELSKLLEQQVQDKLRQGYSIPTYALDAASRDRVKRGLKPHGHELPHENNAAEHWQEYIRELETGAGTFIHERPAPETSIPTPESSITCNQSCSSAGLWKARRH